MADYDGLVSILTEVREIINSPNTDITWTHYESVDMLLSDLDLCIESARKRQATIHEKIRILFAPTGVLQEVSIDGDWGTRFLEVSELIDSIL